MATTVKRLTYDDLESIPQQHEGDRHEIIDGELVVTPPPATKHQTVSSNLVYALERIVREQRLGRVYTAATGIRFTSDTVLIPDILFITQERLSIIDPQTMDAPPDLVVEILSPGIRQRDLEVKREVYAQFGVREYWVVDPDACSVTVLALTGDKHETVPLKDDGEIRSHVLPGLSLALTEVFMGTTGP